MTEFILYILLTSGWIWGVNCLFQEGHIFEKAGDWMDLHWPQYINKPLWDCAACMASVHGTLFYLIFVLKDYGIFMWPVFCTVLCGFNFVIIKLTSKERILKEE